MKVGSKHPLPGATLSRSRVVRVRPPVRPTGGYCRASSTAPSNEELNLTAHLSETAGSLRGLRSIVAASVTIAAIASASCARAVDTDAIARTLTQLDDAWSKAAATRNADSVASYYAVDAIAYPPSAPVAVGQTAAKAVWAACFADSSYAISWKTDHASVSQSGDLGFTAGTYEESFRRADGTRVTLKGKYLCVWKQQEDGTWKGYRDIWNTDSM